MISVYKRRGSLIPEDVFDSLPESDQQIILEVEDLPLGYIHEEEVLARCTDPRMDQILHDICVYKYHREEYRAGCI